MSLKIDIFGKLLFDLTCFFSLQFTCVPWYMIQKKIFIFLITIFFKITYLIFNNIVLLLLLFTWWTCKLMSFFLCYKLSQQHPHPPWQLWYFFMLLITGNIFYKFRVLLNISNCCEDFLNNTWQFFQHQRSKMLGIFGSFLWVPATLVVNRHCTHKYTLTLLSNGK